MIILTIKILQCEAVRKNTICEIQNNENSDFLSEYSGGLCCLAASQ
jgi:hypothetical protein